MSSDVKRYHSALIGLHWFLALAILGMYVFGSFVLDDMHNDAPGKPALLGWHLIVGVAILLLTVLRLVVRVRTPRPAPLVTGKTVADKLAVGMQHLMYTLTVLIVLSGLALAYSADLFSILFGHVGSLPKDFEDYAAHDVHGLLVNALLVVVALHVAAALQHQFILKDGIFSRMSFLSRD
ncbi:MAG: cytochrome b [Sideroxydans sp.]|nr:cytochrome b [Sideroxydans sp.]